MPNPDDALRRFCDASLDLFCTANLEGYLTWVSHRFVDVLGHSEETLLSTPFIEWVHPDDVESTLEEIATLTEGRPTIQFANRYRCADGNWRWLEWNTNPVDGVLYCNVRDVTERREAARDTERRLRLLEMSLETGKLGYWVVDLVDESVHWSREVYAIHGLDPNEHTPTLASGIDAYHPDDREKVTAHIQQAIDSRKPFDFELRLLRPDGEVRLVHSLGRPTVDPSGAVTEIFGVFRDLTDDNRVRRQEELEQFAFVASHDLKEPLRTIETYIELLDDVLNVPDDYQEYWRFVHAAARRMGNMVDDLLGFARAGVSLELTEVDLQTLFESLLQDLDASIRETGATINIGKLPVVLGAEGPLRQVFQNLLSNSLKFRSEATPTITITARRDQLAWVLEVADNGVGFDPAYVERIFRPFQRLRTDAPGTGIGLSIARRIARECGGAIRAISMPGRGSTFSVTLRAAEER